jgi:hypothetical protein
MLTLAASLLLLCYSPAFAQDLKRQGSFGVQFAPVPQAGTAKFHLAKGRGILVRRAASGNHHQAPFERSAPAVLFITGIGCGSQDNLPPDSTLAELLYGLTRRGFVTMRVEKSGVGDSEGPPCMSPQADLRAEVRGYVAGLKALKGHDFVDGGNVFLFGLSIGGVVAPLVAREVPAKGLVVAETVGTSWYEYELTNLRRSWSA